jgi:hypothetical protein
MESHQVGAPLRTERPGVGAADRSPQMEASQPGAPKAPAQAEFGGAGGPAFLFRDLASI